VNKRDYTIARGGTSSLGEGTILGVEGLFKGPLKTNNFFRKFQRDTS